MNKNKKAFTLVELIVVITILAILGTIAFISLQGYSQSSRNSVRISDISKMKTSLEIFQLNSGKYPQPTGGEQVTYKLEKVWIQGTFGEQTTNNIGRLSKIPKDPLNESEYTYSLLNTNLEYQLGSILEGSETLSNLNIVNNALAKDLAIAYLDGTYNGVFARVNNGTGIYVLAIPSIISTDITETTLELIIENQKLSYTNTQNIPSSYIGYTQTGGFDFEPSGDIEVYSGSMEELSSSGTLQQKFIANLQTVYSGTIIQLEPEINVVIDSEDPEQKQFLAGTYITNQVGGLGGINTAIFSYLNCEFNGDPVLHSTSVTAYLLENVLYGNICLTEQRTCYNGMLSGSHTFSTCSVAGATGTFTLNQTTVMVGTDVTITNNCSIAPTSYTSSNTSVATIVGTTITTLTDGTTNITPVGGACGNNSSKVLTVTPAFGTFTLNPSTVIVGTDVTITNNCSIAPTGYTSSNTSVATVESLTTITTKTAGTTNITPVGGACEYSSSKILTVTTPPVTFLSNCSANGQIIYADSEGIEIGRVNNVGTTISGNPGNIDCGGNIILCTGDNTGNTIKACNVGSSIVGTGAVSYGKYFQWGNNGGDSSLTVTPLNERIDGSLYGPGTANGYYNNPIFRGGWISSPFDWSLPSNDNLWGDTLNTSIARQGPCDVGYHIPNQIEWGYFCNLWGGSMDMVNTLQIPLAGRRKQVMGNIENSGTKGYYWSSSILGGSYTTESIYLSLDNSNISTNNRVYRGFGLPIRCIKN